MSTTVLAYLILFMGFITLPRCAKLRWQRSRKAGGGTRRPAIGEGAGALCAQFCRRVTRGAKSFFAS